MKLKGLLFIAVLAFSCKQKLVTEDNQDSEESKIIGTWYSEKLVFTSDYLTDSAQTQEIYVSDFPELYQMSGVRAVYKNDSTFSSAYLGLDSQVVKLEKGLWFISGDQLHIVYSPAGVLDTFSYDYELAENTGQFSTIMDWDGDGEKDDKLVLESRFFR